MLPLCGGDVTDHQSRLNTEPGSSSALSLLAGALLSYLDALGWTRMPVPTTNGSLTLARSRTAPSVDDDADAYPEKDADTESHFEEDEQLAKALQESLNIDSAPRYDHGNLFPPYPYYYPSGYSKGLISSAAFPYSSPCLRIAPTINPAIKRSITQDVMFARTLYQQMQLVSLSIERILFGFKNTAQHMNMMGLLGVAAVKEWSQVSPKLLLLALFLKAFLYVQPSDTRYLVLDDGRKLCLECLDSAVMDTHECQPLYLEIQDFYEGLNMKVEQQIPLLLVERQALNEAMEGEKNGHHHLPETRGLCLSEEQIVSTILRRPRIGGYRIIDMFTEPYRLVRHCYRNLTPDVEEGICQVLAHMWLDSEIAAGSGSSVASSSESSSSYSSSSTSSKKGKRSQFEKKLGEFFKHQIESDTSAAYGEGFREGNKAVLKYGLKRTLDHIRLTERFP
ncbi:hypothetical protein RHGRI_037485 [Rhododendron griersonianum]|uniref:Protein DA1-like domain-containing protein n=1 Tax=Rhododendron griersonianum TaxID=479676 RepID=A0AAV6HXC7_9ERIC|nr:hypothetical protein RHGRI_037485 [Rhododendron griersonianum]